MEDAPFLLQCPEQDAQCTVELAAAGSAADPAGLSDVFLGYLAEADHAVVGPCGQCGEERAQGGADASVATCWMAAWPLTAQHLHPGFYLVGQPVGQARDGPLHPCLVSVTMEL